MGHKWAKLLGPILMAAFTLWLLLTGLQNVAAAPGPTDTILLDGSPNPLMPVDVAVNVETGLAYVINQGAGHVWVISATEYITTIDPPPEMPRGGCPGPTPYGACLNSVNVNPFTGKAYVTQWYHDRVQIISGTELIGWVYGGQGPANTVMHLYTDTVYSLAKWCWGRHGVTVIKGDDDKVLVPGPFADAGCVNPVNGYAYIPNPFVDEVLVIDDLIPIAGIPVGSYPNGAACSESGHVYIVNSGSTPATVSVITGTQVIADIPVGQSTTDLGVDCMWGTKLSGSTDIVAVNEQTGYVYVSNWFSDTVSIINDTAWITDVAVGGRPNSIGVYTPTNTVYVANVFSDSVSVIGGTEVIVTVPVGDYPIALDVNSSNGYVYVVNRDSDSVSIIHGAEVVATIGRLRPRALTAQGGWIYSANSNGTVSVVEGADLLATIAVDDDPQAIIGDGTYVYVANAGSASVSVISGTSPITTLGVGANPRALAVYTPTNRVYVANAASDTVSVLNGLAVETTIAVGGGPSALAADPASGDIFVANTLSNTVTIINGVSQVGNDVQVGSGPQAIAFNPVNGYAYVANSLSATVSILDGTTLLATRPVSATPAAVAVHPGTSYVYVAARDDDVVNVLQDTDVVATIPVGDQPNAIAVDRDLGFVYVTCEGSDRVWVLSGTISLDLDFIVGDQPVDVVIEPASGEGYVANYGDASLSRVQNLPPTISSATPDRTEVGRSITTTLDGSGYFLTPTVWLNSTLVENVQRVASTTLTVQVPDILPVGEYTITVRTADGLTGAKVNGFTVTQRAPTVTAISPTYFPNHLTTTVRITGSGFISVPTGSVGDVALQDVTWLSSEVITAQIPLDLAPGRYQTIFFDNVEQSTEHWSPESVWQLTFSDYHSTNRAWYAGDGSIYGTLYLDSPLDLTTIPHPQLSFWERRSGTWYYDSAYVELSTNDGASWHVLHHATTSTDWQQTPLDLSAYATNPSVMLRFRINGYLPDAGWYVDDIHVGSMSDGLLITNPGLGSPTGYLTAPFTVTNRADHFVFDPISSPQITGEPFTVTITAQDAFSYSAQGYVGAATLSATAPISPAIAGPFSGGVWSGLVQIDAVQADVVITATDTLSEAISGSSAPFDVSPGQAHHFVFDSIPSPQVKDQPFTITITACDVLSYPVPEYTGTAALSATAPISPVITDHFVNGVWSGLVQIDAAQTNVVITATDTISPGIGGSSMPFDVCALPEITLISWLPTNPVANQVITFNVSVDPDAAPPISYTWDFGDYRPLYGICYGPYRAGQSPELGIHPSRDEICEDMNILDDFTSQVRIYTARDIATDVIQLAVERGISVTLGAWIDADYATNDLEIASLISLTNQYTNVTAVVVGNEQLLFSTVPKYKLISYIEQVQQAVSVPVSTAEPWSIWSNPANQDLVDAVDYLLVHIHPLWENVSSSDAVDYVAQKYNEVRTQYPDKPFIIGETGWPSAGSDVGDAHPGLVEQQQFVEGFAAWAADNDVQYLYFEAFDEPWKCKYSDKECHWGLFTEERWPKPAIGPSLTTTSTIVTYTYKSGGDYTVRVGAENACGQALCGNVCGQVPYCSATISVCQPITAVHILGPSEIFTDTPVLLTADYEPDNATTPITLTWNNGTVGENASYTWHVAGTYTVVVTATNRCGNFVTDTHPITVHHIARVELAPDRTDDSANPDSVVTYTHVLTNTGNYTDTIDLTHHSSQGWPVEYDTPISIGYGQTAALVVSITVPADVISGTVDTTIVTATSQTDSNVWASVTDTTIVEGWSIYLPLIFKSH